jgi:hypothetical protein
MRSTLAPEITFLPNSRPHISRPSKDASRRTEQHGAGCVTPWMLLQWSRCPTQKRWEFNECCICTRPALRGPRIEHRYDGPAAAGGARSYCAPRPNRKTEQNGSCQAWSRALIIQARGGLATSCYRAAARLRLVALPPLPRWAGYSPASRRIITRPARPAPSPRGMAVWGVVRFRSGIWSPCPCARHAEGSGARKSAGCVHQAGGGFAGRASLLA